MTLDLVNVARLPINIRLCSFAASPIILGRRPFFWNATPARYSSTSKTVGHFFAFSTWPSICTHQLAASRQSLRKT